MHRVAAWLQRRFPVLHPGLPEIVAWCDGRSDPADARRIALHLVSCARCRMHVELLYEGRRRLLHSSSEPRRPPHRPSLSFLPADVNRRLGAAAARYFGTRAADQVARGESNDLLSVFLGRRAAASSAVSKPSRLESVPLAIALSLAFVLIVGPAASVTWWTSGSTVWLDAFFSYGGTSYLLTCSALVAVLSFLIWRQFAKGERLRPAWFLIFLSGVSQTAGVVARHVLGGHSGLAADMATMSSPLYLALLAAGLSVMLAACRRSGVLPRLRPLDFILMGIVTAFTTHYFVRVVVPTSGSGNVIQVFAAWTTDPLLCVLLLEAILILRSAANMGWGLIPRCWLAFTAAIFLTSLGDMGLWAFAEGYLSPPLIVLSWHVWFVAGACFALGPAFQLQAMRQAARGYTIDEPATSLDTYGRVSARSEA